MGASLAGAKPHRVETERAGHSTWSAARRWQIIRGAVGEEQPGMSQKTSHLTCTQCAPHLPLPDEGLLEVGRQHEKSKCSLFLVTPPHWPLPATLAWAAHLMAETCAPLTCGQQPCGGGMGRKNCSGTVLWLCSRSGSSLCEGSCSLLTQV